MDALVVVVQVVAFVVTVALAARYRTLVRDSRTTELTVHLAAVAVLAVAFALRGSPGGAAAAVTWGVVAALWWARSSGVVSRRRRP